MPTLAALACVLVVDDEPLALQIVGRMLRGAGYRTLEATGARQALTLIAQAHPPIDLVVTDIKLPGLSGVDLVASMQQNFPDIPVIAISGYSDIDTAINVLKHGAADFIAKPFELAALQESTRAALEKTRVYREIRHLRHGLNNGACWLNWE